VLYPERAMSAVFKERFVEAFGVSDMAGLGVAAENARYYTLLLKTQGARFSQSDHRGLSSNADVIGAAMTKHFFYKFQPERTPAVSLDLVLGGEADFADVTERERDMCRGILKGSSSKEIASDLGISVNSVLTYRKRLYQRLSISSQHELFARVLRATLYKRARAV
jgi:DNA-binding CsgD family transcriptional regulator